MDQVPITYDESSNYHKQDSQKDLHTHYIAQTQDALRHMMNQSNYHI